MYDTTYQHVNTLVFEPQFASQTLPQEHGGHQRRAGPKHGIVQHGADRDWLLTDHVTVPKFIVVLFEEQIPRVV